MRTPDVTGARRCEKRHRRRQRPPILLGLGGGVLLTGLAFQAATSVLVRVLLRGREYPVSSVPARPVALVLGAEVYPSGRPSPFLRGRLDVALALFRAGKVRVIVVSGDNATESYNEPEAMRAYLIGAGVPAERVIADYAGFDTYHSCVRAKRVFGIERLIVVTQGYHLPRAIATCRLVGVNAIGVGDYSVKPDSGTWVYGERREVLANLKLMWDVVSGRTPRLGPRETSVDEALGYPTGE